MSNLYDIIFQRKSTRSFRTEPITQGERTEIDAQLACLTPLFAGIRVAWDCSENVKGLFAIKAPQYLSLFSETKQGFLENAGFLLEQMDLWLIANGYGACWLGVAKPNIADKDGLPFVITMAFGRAKDSPLRALDAFTRKPLSEIAEGNDPRLAAARLAPSATNAQPCTYVVDHGNIHVYREALGAVKKRFYDRMQQIDTGIALEILREATLHQGDTFSYTQMQHPEVAGKLYMGTIPKATD